MVEAKWEGFGPFRVATSFGYGWFACGFGGYLVWNSIGDAVGDGRAGGYRWQWRLRGRRWNCAGRSASDIGSTRRTVSLPKVRHSFPVIPFNPSI